MPDFGTPVVQKENGPEVREHLRANDQTPIHQEEVMTESNATPNVPTPSLSTCEVEGCTGLPSLHFGRQAPLGEMASNLENDGPLHGTAGIAADDGSWAVASYRTDDSLWEMTTKAEADQTPENAEAVALAMLFEARNARALNTALMATVFA